jgi:glycine dehydrogenase
VFASGVRKLGYHVADQAFFDTVKVSEIPPKQLQSLLQHLENRGINVRQLENNSVTVALDETTTEADLTALFDAFAAAAETSITFTPSSKLLVTRQL